MKFLIQKNLLKINDFLNIKSILDKYQIKYIFVGAKEYEKYPNLDPNRFDLVDAKVVFQSGQTRIYQLP